MTDAMGNFLYSVGAATGWWVAAYYDSYRTRWITVTCAAVFTLPALLRGVVLYLGYPIP